MDGDQVDAWLTGARDQMEAASAANDPLSYARTALDGLLRAARMECLEPDGTMDFYRVMATTATKIDHPNLMLVFAEAMCRLHNQGVPHG